MTMAVIVSGGLGNCRRTASRKRVGGDLLVWEKKNNFRVFVVWVATKRERRPPEYICEGNTYYKTLLGWKRSAFLCCTWFTLIKWYKYESAADSSSSKNICARIYICSSWYVPSLPMIADRRNATFFWLLSCCLWTGTRYGRRHGSLRALPVVPGNVGIFYHGKCTPCLSPILHK